MPTFDELVNETAGRLNLTSPEAINRIGQRINTRYKKVTSSIGLQTSRRTIKDLVVASTSPDSKLPDVVVAGMEKILAVRVNEESGSTRVLKKLTYDEIVNVNPGVSGILPRAWADKRIGSQQCTITLDSWMTTPFTMHLEGYDLTDVLVDDAEPFLPEDFHDVLVEGAMSDELRKMEKPQLAMMAEQNYERRLSDLRHFLARNAYADIAQGKDKPSQLWYRPWFSRISLWD